MSSGITMEDLNKWVANLRKAKFPKPAMIEIWANEDAFDKMPDKMFISMCEDKRILLHATSATIKKISDRYKKLKKKILA